MTWRMIVKSGKSSSGSPIASGLHSAAESAPVLVSPRDTTAAAVTADAAVPMLTVIRRDQRPRFHVPRADPSAQTIVPPAPTATETPGRFCSRTAGARAPRALDGRGKLRRRRRIDERWTSWGCAKTGVVTVTACPVCRERRHEDADGQRGARGRGRQLVPRGLHAEPDRADHQQQPDDGSAGRVVRIRDVHADGPDCQGEGDEGGRLTLFVTVDVIHHCDRSQPRSPHRIMSAS